MGLVLLDLTSFSFSNELDKHSDSDDELDEQSEVGIEDEDGSEDDGDPLLSFSAKQVWFHCSSESRQILFISSILLQLQLVAFVCLSVLILLYLGLCFNRINFLIDGLALSLFVSVLLPLLLIFRFADCLCVVSLGLFLWSCRSLSISLCCL